MLQDAINQISGIINLFPIIYKIAIHEKDYFTIYYFNKDYHEKSFINAIDLLEWCEQNLQTKD
jgi:hypothetical protein